MEQGYCVKGDRSDQNSGVVRLWDKDRVMTPLVKDDCLRQCGDYLGATGCEIRYSELGNMALGCDVHTAEIARGNNAAEHDCWVFSKCTGNYLL